MKQFWMLKTVLILSGLIGLIVGAGALFVPVQFHATSGITLDGSINLMSEMRASGGALFASGGIKLAGAFLPRLSFTSTLLATVAYLSYGLSRLISISMDGVPSAAILQIAGIEIVVGLICGAVLIFFRESETFS